ncbi:RagB/SusD family nutrient uptake outer membrane protein [Chitinophaga sp. GCM10012297]|uniref:RagB/SusD family nutrient uptake outer membrane protein n=1 Tax=Chitinophaga chungangae TaxID=2821488 RepID=A0ABS3Y9N1_9BACT|nr:RagB/SusD family nutrient uptake outer membrane protein [Chitinophaga chungangae]MBO9151195.1 RagB/SusD family nutrient uptake outer membrane protein [Chitinophaga chungangae]
MNKFTKLSLSIILVLSSVQCRKGFLDEEPKAIIAPDNLYVNKAGFDAGLYGLYSQVRSERKGINGASNDLTSTAAIIGVDNAYSLYPAGGAAESVFNDFGVRMNPTAGYIRNLWEYLYQTINAANTIVDRADNPDVEWTEDEKNQVLAEARLIRAWAYRHLTYLWGNVPLNLHESDGNSIRTDWERTPVAEVRAAMEQDWLFAEAHLPDVPVMDGRASKVVAQHYLAELYLAMGENEKAREKAQAVVSNGNYNLITARYGVNANQPGTPFTDMFLDKNSNRSEGNREVLWTFQNEYLTVGGDVNIMRRWWVNRYNTIKVNNKTPITFSVENGGRGIGRFAATKYAFSVYGPGDDRGSYHAWRYFYLINNPSSLPTGSKPTATCAAPGWTGSALGDTIKLSIDCEEPNPSATTAQNWPSTRKWDWAPPPPDVENSSNYNDQVYLRLAETYLLLAEAQFKLNDPSGAATTINALRNRAHATPIDAADVNMNFILDERSRELFSEEHRRYTLLRTGTWFARTKQYNRFTGAKIALRDTLLPIPQSVIDANLTKPMEQNLGYDQ